ERPMVWFNLAAARAMASSKKEAIAALRKSIELGFKDRELLASDERFASIRSTPEYAGVIQALGGK
ncbi:MAG: TPR end-of-group domain-containing protein, partial [Acidobacteriota bacterium]